MLQSLGRLLPLAVALLLTACSGDAPTLEPLSGDATLLAFGDSITRGVGAPADRSYPAVLERLTGRRVVNAGVPGEVTAQGRQRLPEVLERVQPDLLLLCHGGNDLLRRKADGDTEANLRAMIRQARGRDIPVVLIGVPKPKLFLMESAAFYGRLAEEFGVPLEAEVLPEVEADNALKSDQIHPNARGYRRIAEAVQRLLKTHGAL